jgi:hypothetical protein
MDPGTQTKLSVLNVIKQYNPGTQTKLSVLNVIKQYNPGMQTKLNCVKCNKTIRSRYANCIVLLHLTH